MTPDSCASKLDAITFAVYANESEIACAAPDIADKYNLSIEEFSVGTREMAGNPGIKRGCGFF